MYTCDLLSLHEVDRWMSVESKPSLRAVGAVPYLHSHAQSLSTDSVKVWELNQPVIRDVILIMSCALELCSEFVLDILVLRQEKQNTGESV